jgi:hypothetical protein
MFSVRTPYIAAKAAIRYKKDGLLAKSVCPIFSLKLSSFQDFTLVIYTFSLISDL